ncbi:NAD(P)-dependent oxidoreductase [uncultured Vagococcus sp.]|uniref:NAD(P)-dependent oxidoreductase n=1 Tax=uncultured Vagococcus sp. TaxID=189676 RepID=UPI0028D0CA77|nr:NAD(P)-dependent oxidoreductase [uncultured Vagococcus sp.]
MKIVISDYPDSMMPTHDEEQQLLRTHFPDCEIVIYEYSDEKRQEFFNVIHDADAILTAFMPIDEEAMSQAPGLKVISLNATGYDNVDLSAATQRGIGVCPVGEYSTIDVAEFTMAMMMSLVKNLKQYGHDIDHHHQWRFDYVTPNPRLQDMTLGILGFGKIGQAVAKRALALGMTVIACDPFIDQKILVDLNVTSVTQEKLFATADVISNHMNLTDSNKGLFNRSNFLKMTQRPYLINMGRGASIIEADLIWALDQGHLKGAGLDLLGDETPDLTNHPLVGRSDVLITPHAAFYSTTSIKELKRISTENIVYYLQGQMDKVFKLVNEGAIWHNEPISH